MSRNAEFRYEIYTEHYLIREMDARKISENNAMDCKILEFIICLNHIYTNHKLPKHVQCTPNCILS